MFGYKSTRQTTLSKVYLHPLGYHVEYPISAVRGHVGHVFAVDPRTAKAEHPRKNICYGLGYPRGMHHNRTCELLRDDSGQLVLCDEEFATCQGVKICEFSDISHRSRPHVEATRDALRERLAQDADHLAALTVQQLLLRKTVALKAALEQERCGCPLDKATNMSAESEQMYEQWKDDREKARRGQPVPVQCQGQLIFDRNIQGAPRCHRIDYSRVQQVDAGYLEALFNGDEEELERFECEPQAAGWGPRGKCFAVANSSSSLTSCPCPHRSEDRPGELVRGTMTVQSCSARFQIFTPYDLQACPRIALITSGCHYHPIPLPTRTPPSVEKIVGDLLLAIGPDLSDMTPRRFMRHPVVRTKLRQLMPTLNSPTLTDLHVSLVNKDHLRVIIDRVKGLHFPFGTDWQGLLNLKRSEDETLKVEDQYIRVLIEEKPDAEDSKPLRFVVCMTPSSSRRLVLAQFIQSDISFKRAPGYLEFELVGWDHQKNVAVTYCRAFINRQTAEAHRRLLHAIDEVVEKDTGTRLSWRHIHAEEVGEMTGILLWATDQHLGQANGIGLYLRDVADMCSDKRDLHEPSRFLTSLTVHDHLRRLLRLCDVHLKRNIKTCKVNESVKAHMRSILCLTHSDLNGTIETIRREGGKAGSDWIDDKIKSGFALPAICWELSFIPKEVWLAGDSNTNITEAAHADVNREGTGCTLLGAVMKGREFDMQKDRVLRALADVGIGPRSVPRNDFFRHTKALKRNRKHASISL
ncbi:hypothetical protein BD410DRAFT_724512 [Rickenella mellea]|uniref:Uncharacterized protein n=1 Tax=Rickenella mellea TaxID=50990 RepID=A0A4Y7Q0K3_9AGAM|nr:hypothetical protein BD410DRAFT_724512 [Rickenella mellea]